MQTRPFMHGSDPGEVRPEPIRARRTIERAPPRHRPLEPAPRGPVERLRPIAGLARTTRRAELHRRMPRCPRPMQRRCALQLSPMPGGLQRGVRRLPLVSGLRLRALRMRLSLVVVRGEPLRLLRQSRHRVRASLPRPQCTLTPTKPRPYRTGRGLRRFPGMSIPAVHASNGYRATKVAPCWSMHSRKSPKSKT